MKSWAGFLVVLLFAPILTTGCKSPSEGNSGGRVAVSETTRAEKRSAQPRTADLIEASDQVAMQLAADLDGLAREDFGGYRVTLILGDILNKSGTAPVEDFEVIQQRVKDKLLESRVFRENVKVVENRGRLERLNAEEIGDAPDDDLLQQAPEASATDRNPAYTFYLLGDAYGVHRDSTHLYYITFKLVRADREVVFSKRYEVKYDVSRGRHR